MIIGRNCLSLRKIKGVISREKFYIGSSLEKENQAVAYPVENPDAERVHRMFQHDRPTRIAGNACV